MKIVYISMFDMQAASSIRLHNYASEIAKLGHDVTFIAASGTKRTAEGVKMVYMDEVEQKPFRGISLTVSALLSLLKVERPDIIHFSKPLPVLGLPSMLYREIFPCKIICDWDDIEGELGFSQLRGFPEKQIITFFESWIPNRADGITPISRAIEKLAKKYSNRILYLPNLAMVNKFSPKISGSKMRKRYGWGGKKILLFTGGFGKYSDAPICIRAMKHIGEKNVLLTIFGREERKQAMERMIVDLGLKGRVKIYDPIPFEEMPQLLAAADILLSPMNKEWANNYYRLPLKVSEYMAAGKPIVTQDVGETRLLVGNAAYVTKSNEEDFAKGIVKALHDGRKMGLLARKRAEKEFFTKQVKRLEKFYESFS